MARLQDNSNGFWFELIRRKKNPDLVIKQRFVPNDALMRTLGNEAISSIKGSVKHKVAFSVVNNNPVFHAFASGQYPRGIIKRISPEGQPYEPLAESTIRHRKFKGIGRGSQFILRETSQTILAGLKIKKLTRPPQGGKRVEIGWSEVNEEIVRLQDEGGTVISEFFGKEKESEIAPRPFRGWQPMFIDNFFAIMRQFYK